MPVFLMTFHAFGTWEPDRPEGYWHHTAGRLHQDRREARRRRCAQTQASVRFTPDVQRAILEGAIAAAVPLKVILRAMATSVSHVHPLLMWRDAREATLIRRDLKQALTLALNRRFPKRTWFVRKGWCERVREEEHLEHLLHEYLPSHEGWCWSARTGWRSPRERNSDRVS